MSYNCRTTTRITQNNGGSPAIFVVLASDLDLGRLEGQEDILFVPCSQRGSCY